MLIKKLNHFFINVTKEFTFTENKNCKYNFKIVQWQFNNLKK